MTVVFAADQITQSKLTALNKGACSRNGKIATCWLAVL